MNSGSFSRAVIDAGRLLDSIYAATREWVELLDGVSFTLDERRLAIIRNTPDTLKQVLLDPDVADQLVTLHGHLVALRDLPLPVGLAATA